MSNSRATLKEWDKIAVYLSPSKLTRLLFGLILFFSATQLGFHFWPTSSLVYGIRIDYLAPTIYFLDILIILFLVLRTLLERNSRLQVEKGSAAAERRVLTSTIVPILLVNLLFSANPLATLSWSLHFLLYLSFVMSLPPTRTLLERNSRLQVEKGSAAAERRVLNIISKALPLAIFFQLLVSAAQVFQGHSIGGWLYYLGERIVSVGQPAVATATFMGHVALRAYATFGHPNVLAGWLVICLLILRTLLSKRVLIGILLLTTLGVLLAQSRAAAISLFFLVIPFYLIKKTKSRILYFILLLIPISYLISTGSLTRASDLALGDRLNLQGLSLQVIAHYPVFGTGSQAGISTYPIINSNVRLLQPDHDSFTLFLSWFGIFGVLAIFQIIPCTSSAKAREKCLQTLCSLGGLLPILLLDHYLLTSPQGLFFLLLYLRCCEK